ncbi:MAG TPA: hypothetical protein VMS21_16145 [Methylomirabilota bacterium]|nr:hypothetical protein [Methylomirabilota bacterium]
MTGKWRFKTLVNGKEHELFTCTDDDAVNTDLSLPQSKSLLRTAETALAPGETIESLLERDPQNVHRLLAASVFQHHLAHQHGISAACAPELIPEFSTAGCTSNDVGGDGQSYLLRIWERPVS